MKADKKQTIWILVGIVVLVGAVVAYMVFPLDREKLNSQAVAGQAATYYDAIVGQQADSIDAPAAQRAVEGD